MFYEITDSVKEINFKNISPEVITIGIISIEQLEKYNKYFNFSESTILECKNDTKNLRSSVDIYDEYSFGIINIINKKDILGDRDKIGFYIKANLFLLIAIVDKDKSVTKLLKDMLLHIKLSGVTLERIMYAFFERLIYEDNIVLEDMQLNINKIEEKVNNGLVKNFNDDFSKIRKELLLLRNYYEQLIDVGEEIQENENAIFNEEDLRYFKIFTDRVTRLSNNTQMLRDYIAQVREAYQAKLDYDLNSIMKVFTVFATIFLPLTLIVGWYGMNFTTMPELNWKYGYLYTIILSITVVIVCMLYFKKKKLL